jgi:hypothetical protein
MNDLIYFGNTTDLFTQTTTSSVAPRHCLSVCDSCTDMHECPVSGSDSITRVPHRLVEISRLPVLLDISAYSSLAKTPIQTTAAQPRRNQAFCISKSSDAFTFSCAAIEWANRSVSKTTRLRTCSELYKNLRRSVYALSSQFIPPIAPCTFATQLPESCKSVPRDYFGSLQLLSP